MTAKKYLSEIIAMRKTTAALEDRIELLRVQASSLKAIKYDKDKVQVSDGRTLEDAVIDLIEAEEEYAVMLSEYHRAVRKRIRQIEGLENHNYTQVLLLRYVVDIDGRMQSLEEIAEQMGLSFDRVAHLHTEALDAFAERYGLHKDSKQ